MNENQENFKLFTFAETINRIICRVETIDGKLRVGENLALDRGKLKHEVQLQNVFKLSATGKRT